MTDCETGRVVAVFYNDYDCQNVIDIQDENEALKAENEIIENKVELLTEDIECVNMWLDNHKVPRLDGATECEYSIIGRVKILCGMTMKP